MSITVLPNRKEWESTTRLIAAGYVLTSVNGKKRNRLVATMIPSVVPLHRRPVHGIFDWLGRNV